MATVQQYRAHLKRYGLAKPNRFEVEFELPDKLTQEFLGVQNFGGNSIFSQVGNFIREAKEFLGIGGPNFRRGLSMMCERTDMPGKNMNTVENKINGIQHKQVYGKMYAEQQFVFSLSGDMYEKQIIDAWMKLMVNSDDYNVAFFRDYASTIAIHQLNDAGVRVHSIILEGAFPTNMNPLTMSNNDNNIGHKLMCSFAYQEWHNADILLSGGHTNILTTALGPAFQKIINRPGGRIALSALEKMGINLTGEALNVYNQLDNILRDTVDMDTNTTVRLLNSIKADVGVNTLLNAQDRSDLFSVIDNISSAI